MIFLVPYKKMENRFWLCCFDSVLIGTRSECDRFSCQEGKYNPPFNLYYHKNNNRFFYCLNRDQLGQYWKCMVEDRNYLCPQKCDKCVICKEMTGMFVELQDSYFFYPKTHLLTIKKIFLINQFFGAYLIKLLIKIVVIFILK